MVSAKEIRDATKAMLIAGKPKNSKGKKIVKWFNAQPPEALYPDFPFGWLQWMGGPVTPSTMATKAKIIDNFAIVVLDKYPNGEVVENSILSFYEAIKAVLDADPTLTGTVAISYISNREADRFYHGDYSMAGLRITLYTRRSG